MVKWSSLLLVDPKSYVIIRLLEFSNVSVFGNTSGASVYSVSTLNPSSCDLSVSIKSSGSDVVAAILSTVVLICPSLFLPISSLLIFDSIDISVECSISTFTDFPCLFNSVVGSGILSSSLYNGKTLSVNPPWSIKCLLNGKLL
uniref:Uncharacterized protein n=1 Tax=Cacopsylla melanoneura TaxID=428564 RepID=A0A8D8LPE8_9HEMI